MRIVWIVFAAVVAGCGQDDAKPAAAGDTAWVGCGDGIVQAGEACDDGNGWGGDGCDPTCATEEALLEAEPNDDADSAQAVELPATVHGGLPTRDRDCFAFEVPEAGAVVARLRPDGAGGCADAVVELLDADGVRLTAGLPGLGGCAAVDAATDVWARYLPAGRHAVCVGTLFEGVVAGYTLDIAVQDSCADLPALPLEPSVDLEGDGVADVCDGDDDDDGVPDGVDNCPAAPNGPDAPFPWTTAPEGFVTLWLVLGPFTEGVTPKGCEPSPDSFAGPDDADVAAVLGDEVDGTAWFAWFAWPGQSAVLRFTDWFAPDAPREAYAATWVRSPAARKGEITLGADDGFKVWVNGAELGVHGGCQGVGTDQFVYPVSLEAGWNRVLTKVYDGGGGWGQIVRFRHLDGSAMTDLEISIGGAAPWEDDQGDMDGDGVGDMCDETPTG